MATDTDGLLYGTYQNRIGRPTTDDEVRGYWIFITGLVLAAVGFLLFLPSESATGASGFTLRELSLAVSAAGLAMLVAGPVIRLPLQEWANTAAYLGQVVCLAAVAWFLLVFPADWSVQTGNQPVIVLYAVGLAIIALGGGLGPLLAGVTRDEFEASEKRVAELESELEAVRDERDDFEAKLEQAQSETVADEDEIAQLEAQLESLRTSQAQFEVYEDVGGKYRWRLRHRNSNVIATGGQGYTRKHNAKKGLASVRRNALGATLLEVQPDDEEIDEALADAPLIPETASKAEIELYEDDGGKYRWRLRHRNGTVIATGGQGYASKQKAKQGIQSVQTNAGSASYLRFDPASFQIYRDSSGEWRWRLLHRNGNIIAAPTDGHSRRRGAKREIEAVRTAIASARNRFHVYEDQAGEYRWQLRGENGDLVATSGEGYTKRAEAVSAVDRIRGHIAAADALDIGSAAFEVYKDDSGKWRWRLRHRNGNIIATSSRGYSKRTNAHDAIEGVKTNVGGADLTDA